MIERSDLIEKLDEYTGLLPSELWDIHREAVEALRQSEGIVRCRVCRKRWHDGYCSVNKRIVGSDDYCSEAEVMANDQR